MNRRPAAHRGTTTGPIHVDALMRRLRLERVNAQRAHVGLPARPVPASVATAMPVAPLEYTPVAWRHLVGVVAGCVTIFVVTFVVALWLEQATGYARPAGPRTAVISPSLPPPSSTP